MSWSLCTVHKDCTWSCEHFSKRSFGSHFIHSAARGVLEANMYSKCFPQVSEKVERACYACQQGLRLHSILKSMPVKGWTNRKPKCQSTYTSNLFAFQLSVQSSQVQRPFDAHFDPDSGPQCTFLIELSCFPTHVCKVQHQEAEEPTSYFIENTSALPTSLTYQIQRNRPPLINGQEPRGEASTHRTRSTDHNIYIHVTFRICRSSNGSPSTLHRPPVTPFLDNFPALTKSTSWNSYKTRAQVMVILSLERVI